jgi:hypothetical protein
LPRIVFLVWPDPLWPRATDARSVIISSAEVHRLKAGYVPRTGQLLTEYLPQVCAFALHSLQAAQEDCRAGRLEF